MAPLEYLLEALPDWPGYVLLVVLFAALHGPLLRRWAVGIYDPMFLLLLSNLLGWTIVWFMYLRGDIATTYAVSFTVAQLALYAGIAVGRLRRPQRPAGIAPVERSTLPAVTLLVAAVVHVAATLGIWALAGIPLFRDSRLGAFEGSGGYGILERVAESSALIAVFAVVQLLILRPRRWRSLPVLAFALWYLASIALSGSKAAVLTLAQQVLSILFVYTALRTRPDRWWAGRLGKGLVVVSTVFALAVLAAQQEGDWLGAAIGFGVRVVSYGDIYLFAYPNATIEGLEGHNPLIGLFGGFLSTFRLFPQDAVYPNLGLQFTRLVFPDLDLVVGPNPQHPVFGAHYFGAFAFVFSFVLGLVTAGAQRRFLDATPRTFVGGLVAFMLYFVVINVSVDFEYTLSKIASLVIGGVLVLGPALLICPRTPIFRLPAGRSTAAATGQPFPAR